MEGEVEGKDEGGMGELIDNIVLLVLKSYGKGVVKGVENLVGGVGRDVVNDVIGGRLEELHDEVGLVSSFIFLFFFFSSMKIGHY